MTFEFCCQIINHILKWYMSFKHYVLLSLCVLLNIQCYFGPTLIDWRVLLLYGFDFHQNNVTDGFILSSNISDKTSHSTQSILQTRLKIRIKVNSLVKRLQKYSSIGFSDVLGVESDKFKLCLRYPSCKLA